MSQRRKSNKLFQYAVSPFLILVFLLITPVVCAGQTPQWTLRLRQRVAVLDIVYTSVAYYVPAHPQRILVLAHGYPWPDGTASDETLTEYARADVQRWAEFAEANNVMLLALTLQPRHRSQRSDANRRGQMDNFHPFQRNGSAIKTRHMNLHQFPWPRTELEQFGETEVELLVTLSCYVELNPGERGSLRWQRYALYGLRRQ